jgi:WXG100 family type VII secretion target
LSKREETVVGNLVGADIARLRELAAHFDRDGGALGTLIQGLNRETSGSTEIWRGPAGERFRGEWAQLKPTLDKFVETLHEAAKAVRGNADNIEAATR